MTTKKQRQHSQRINRLPRRLSTENEISPLLASRMIVAEFVEGTSIWDLKPEVQEIAARKILEMESNVLFSNSEKIIYDPDRHPGNFRIHVTSFDGRPHVVLEDMMIKIGAIDFGQVTSLTRIERDSIIELFTLSQIGNRVGPSDWLVGKVANQFQDLSPKQKKQLKVALKQFYPNPTFEPVTAYFALLAALDMSGVKLDTSYFDFVRGVIQLSQYEQFVNGKVVVTPRQKLDERVRSRIEELRPEIKATLKVNLAYVVDEWAPTKLLEVKRFFKDCYNSFLVAIKSFFKPNDTSEKSASHERDFSVRKGTGSTALSKSKTIKVPDPAEVSRVNQELEAEFLNLNASPGSGRGTCLKL